MLAVIHPEVEPDKDDRLGSELRRQVQSVKPGIAAPADCPGLSEHHARPRAVDLQPLELELPEAFDRPPVVADALALILRNTTVMLPPVMIAAVEIFGPGCEPPSILDRDEPRLSSALREFDL